MELQYSNSRILHGTVGEFNAGLAVHVQSASRAHSPTRQAARQTISRMTRMHTVFRRGISSALR